MTLVNLVWVPSGNSRILTTPIVSEYRNIKETKQEVCDCECVSVRVLARLMSDVRQTTHLEQVDWKLGMNFSGDPAAK